ncbi:shikimate 5-dehydrogenase [Enterococcus sp. 8G7_MSG3316]|uniref:Shikimate dehydrogenase (NADP(+)) n=1 Tax=Candidatus Enterococcus testudinis TaxID=1834191 RepID=A0A242A673_9ENTE|nr:shikimate dehydrogenase [Enterococcus sp. 8G7_MSG3316]OTN76452.1 shikimate 5-dehydrogenase [Enterococcus sp. 8G7_MSG3316]
MEKMISGHTRLAALFAKPARHSISPAMHNLSFSETTTDAIYLAFDVEPEDLATSIESIRTLDMLGVNLSMPHKMAAVPLVDELSPAAALIGAINTIVNQQGHLVGHNTDGTGFMRALDAIDVSIIGETITVIGAGGAATAIISQAALDGVKVIQVFNRKDDFYPVIDVKLQEIAQQTGCRISLQDLDDQGALADALAKSQLLVNATGVGMKPNEDVSPLKDTTLLRETLAVYDVIYNPRETQLLKDAKAAGAKTANGLSMLLYQGAAAFELWTGKQMPIEKVRALIDTL